MNWIKTHKGEDALIIFGVLELALILVSILVLKEPVVPVCFILIAEALLAVLMHKSELWIHGAFLLVQLIAAIILGRVLLVVFGMVLYICALLALRYYIKERK